MAELALAIAGVAGTIDTCFKLGKFLVQACKDYDRADDALNELSLRVQVCWSRISSQLEVTRQLESEMTEEQRDFQQRVLHVLQTKLDAAVAVVSKPDRYSRTAKKLHFLGLRDSLETSVADLEAWQKRFEPPYFQLIKVAPSGVEGVLRNVAVGKPQDAADPSREGLRFRRAFDDGGHDAQKVLISEKTLEHLEMAAIPYSAAMVATDPRDDNRHHVIDTVSLATVKLKDAREFAYRLRDSNPETFGTLRCKGMVRLQHESALSFVFRVPDGYPKIQSLREHLLSGRIPESLTVRLDIARQLVTAVYYVHLYDFVHKNVSPETILSLGRRETQGVGSVVCLVGFQVIRYADAKTNTSKKDRKDNLYQHPSRKTNEGIDFVMQHDIYSLGVCLLEVGLWESLLTYGPDGEPHESGALGIPEDALQNCSPEDIEQQLVNLSRGPLRARMGDVYSKVVETCLTCLDDDNTDFGDPREFVDEDGVEVGSQYVKKVMNLMSAILY